ncbi:MAG: hypothetical protein WCS72_16890 [Deltaproteobacteria bacterium]
MADQDIQGSAGPTSTPAAAPKGRLGRAMAWMFILSLLLFWLPVLGMFIAGLVGGRKAGTLGAAVGAVLLPGAVVAVMTFFLASVLTGMPILGAIAALGAGVFVVANVLPLLAGAVIGGMLAP